MPGRRLRPLVAALLATPVLVGAMPAAAQGRPRVVVVTVDGTTLADWARPELAAFAGLMRGGSVALLSTRTAAPPDVAFEVARPAAYATLAAGRRVALPEAGGLGTALASAKEPFSFATSALPAKPSAVSDGVLRAALRGARVVAVAPVRDPSFPGGIRTDFGALAATAADLVRDSRLVVVNTEETARVERTVGLDPAARAAWTRLAMRRTDRLLAAVRDLLQPGDLLLVVSTTPPAERVERRVHLAAIAAVGFGIPRGVLLSGTTRRPGVVSLSDIAPTILSRLGLGGAARMDGRPIEGHAEEDPIPRLSGFERDIVHSLRERLPLTRAMLGAGMVLAALALLTVLGGRGRPPPRGPVPRGWRDVTATLFLAVAAMPVALLVEPWLPTDTRAASVAASAGLAAAIALTARAARGRVGGLVLVLAATAAVAVADTALGSPLAVRSALGFQIAGGGRFYGIDEGLMGVVIGAALFAGALGLDRSSRPRRLVPILAAGFASAVLVMGAPSLGSKFGAPLTAIPAFGVLAARLGGRRIDRVAVLAIAIATVLATASFVAADALRNPETQSHIGRAVEATAGNGSVVGRKVSAFFRITFSTFWLPAFVWLAGSIGVLAWRRRGLLAHGLWGYPHVRAALWAGLVASLSALVANDTGIITAAPIAMLAAATVFVILLAPD